MENNTKKQCVDFRYRDDQKWGGLVSLKGDVVAVGLVEPLFVFSKGMLVEMQVGSSLEEKLIDESHFQIYRRPGDVMNPVYLKVSFNDISVNLNK